LIFRNLDCVSAWDAASTCTSFYAAFKAVAECRLNHAKDQVRYAEAPITLGPYDQLCNLAISNSGTAICASKVFFEQLIAVRRARLDDGALHSLEEISNWGCGTCSISDDAQMIALVNTQSPSPEVTVFDSTSGQSRKHALPPMTDLHELPSFVGSSLLWTTSTSEVPFELSVYACDLWQTCSEPQCPESAPHYQGTIVLPEDVYTCQIGVFPLDSTGQVLLLSKNDLRRC